MMISLNLLKLTKRLNLKNRTFSSARKKKNENADRYANWSDKAKFPGHMVKKNFPSSLRLYNFNNREELILFKL